MAGLDKRCRQPQAAGADNNKAAPATGSTAHQPGNALLVSRTPAATAISNNPIAARQYIDRGGFRAVNVSGKRQAFQPLLGCIPTQGGGTATTDPTYAQTNVDLATYRNLLRLRSAGADGPPPYFACMNVGWYSYTRTPAARIVS